MDSSPVTFDVCGALPFGTTVLEASAGTGKTFTIAALVARYVAEGHAELSELMMITFGRMATDELRSRVRERLVNLDQALTAVLDGRGLPPGADQISELLAKGRSEDVADRRRRIRRALSEFDAATIATTHEFCQRMLEGLGVLGNHEPDAVFAEWLGDLTDEAARDVYLRRYANHGNAPLDFDLGRLPDARKLAQQVVEAPHARLVPWPESSSDPAPDTTSGPPHGPQSAWARRVDYAREVRHEVQRRKVRARLFSYDDMLIRLAEALADPHTGPAAAARLRSRYSIVLVDEFQDTDVVQWDILRRAFHGHSTLILIGDPKQAIYAFRGADVYSYLNAREAADSVASLGENYRSDEALTEALDQLIGGAALGDPRILVPSVRSYHTARRLHPGPRDIPGAVHLAPLRLRLIPPLDDGARLPVDTLRTQIEGDLVADITSLLAAGPLLDAETARQTQARKTETEGRRPLRPSDIAVLVRKNGRGEAIRDALAEAGVPAVMLGTTSVFCAPVAEEWLTLLLALEQPRQRVARSAALTCFLGWGFAELADADDQALTGLAQQIRDWSRVLASRGVAALLEVATVQTRLAERLLSEQGGVRTLTDLRHIGQALHAAMTSKRLGVSALVDWLREQIEQAKQDASSDSARRLETDADAVQILTLHRSKGLEFPIVYLPEAWDSHAPDDDGQVLRLHVDGDCVLDVGGEFGPGRRERLSQARLEDAGEELRLLYVGLTRAQCAVVTWWAASQRNTTGSALHRLLCRTSTEIEPKRSYDLPTDPVAQIGSDRGVTVECVGARSLTAAAAQPRANAELRVRTFSRTLDLEWRRTSYSALTAAAHGLAAPSLAVGSEAEVGWEDDEAQLPTTVNQLSAAEPDVPVPGLDLVSPMQELPGGVLFGTVVHGVLEQVDPLASPRAADLSAELRRICAGVLARTQLVEVSPDALADALLLTMQTPLGPLAEDRRLCDIPVRDRLAELAFELPLAGGENAISDCRLGDVAPLLRRHLPASDPLSDYADFLDHPQLAEQSLRGYLTGSIDAVLRVGAAHDPRYLVVDYKTNWLGTVEGAELRLSDYTPDRMAGAMMVAHYPLQALLYLVAVHRMLRWRQPDYRPDRHLGGVLYLFVRGMAGPDTPRIDGQPCGVFAWRPAAGLVTECSDLLDRGPT
jgi:exodeoxyribonuclease V beta subunit